MKVGIFYNKNYLDVNLSNLEFIQKYFRSINYPSKIIYTIDDLYDIDCVLVLGGDGTILTIASHCAQKNIPIIGINYGHVGFLAEFDPDRLLEALDLLSSQNYHLESRSLLQIDVKGSVFYALNDVVIQRNTSGTGFCNTIGIEAKIDECVMENIKADGVIVSTPTGSTAYSLSAGGSVLSPNINGFIFTPICPHSLQSRPIVFDDNSILKIKLVTHNIANIIVDGAIKNELCQNDYIFIKKAPFQMQFITTDQNNFYQRLLVKLNKWSK